MEPIASRPVRPGSAPDPEALVALLSGECGVDAVERALLAAAVHADLGGADAAWLLRHDESRGLLVGWRGAPVAATGGTLAETVVRARLAPPLDEDADARLRAWAVPVEGLVGALGAAWHSGAVVSHDADEPAGAPWSGFETIAVLPLRRGLQRHGVLVTAWRARPATPPDLGALATLATLGLRTADRDDELRRRARHAGAFAECARTAVTASHVGAASHALVRAVTHGLGVRHAALWSVSPGGGPRLDVEHAEGDESLLGAHAWDAAVAAVIASGRANAGAGHEAPPHAEAAGAWALQPLSAHGRVLGVLAAWDAGESGRSVWESGDLECLAALADQHALLLEHARRLEGAQTADRRVEELVSRLRAQDRVVALGELAGRVSAEALPALLAMRDALTRALAGEGDDEARRALLEGVDAELERVAALLGEQDAYARLDRPRLRMEQLNGVLVTALQEAAEPLARRRVRLVKRLAPDLPELLLDAARIRRVVANLLACALESLPTGGRVRVETRRAGAFVVLELTHDRIEQTGDALEQLFASFSGSAGSGAAVGLGLAHQIVREHGGEIRVRRDEEWTSTLAVTFPVLGNQDRRVRSDRRAGGADRRSRGPGG